MTQQKNNRKSRLRNDLLLIFGLLLISAAALLGLYGFRSGGDTVKVTVDGQLYGIYSLSAEITEDIRIGSHINRLVIRGGKAYIESADCPDGICAAHSPIFRNGESIICLPHRVVVSVFSENDSAEPDLIA